MKKNQVVLKVSQHIPAQVKENGTILAFDNEIEFTDETNTEINTEKLSNWAMCKLKKYMAIERLQGKTGFKLSKDITLTLSVNNRTESVSTKFSLSEERLKRVFERSPKLLSEVFHSTPSIGSATTAVSQNYLFNSTKLVIAEAKEVITTEQSTNDDSLIPAETVAA